MIYKIISKYANKCLNIKGDNLTSLTENKDVCLWSDSGTNEQKWGIPGFSSSLYIRSIVDSSFGLNPYRTGTNWNCDVHTISGNETDALIDIVPSGSYYKIKLANYTNRYLTAGGTSNLSNVYWANASNGDNQLWTITPINNPTSYGYPTTARTISQAYSTNHPAIDIPATTGTPIYAFADGVVAFKQNSSGSWHPDNPNPPYGPTSMQSMGNCIAINHINPDTTKASGAYARTIYMHMRDNPTLQPGATVSKGDIIGYIGSTGRSSGPHLHFSLNVGNLSTMAPSYVTPGVSHWVSISSLPSVNPTVYLPEYHV